MKKVLFVVLLIASVFPGVPSAAALAAGLAFALVTGGVFPAFSKKTSRFLLQAAVVGIGFGMNFNSAIRSGGAGMAMTAVSVVFVMIAGWTLGRMMRLDGKVSYFLIGSTLSLSSLRQVGARALLQGVALWGLTAAASLLIVML